MKRVLIVLGLVAAAGAAGYGQVARGPVVQNFEIFNYTDIYLASMCSDRTFVAGGASANAFMMQAKRPLANNWYEVEVSGSVDPTTKDLRAPVETIRVNSAMLCYVKPIVR